MPTASPDPVPPVADVHLVVNGTNPAVRQALAEVVGALRPGIGSIDDLATAEIVLAEVLNNIVEHAYAATPGQIEVRVRLTPACLIFDLRDDGAQLPGGTLPAGRMADLAVPVDALPEGGFGWFLIRALTENLSYMRAEGRNLLTFSIRLSAPAQAAATDQPAPCPGRGRDTV